MAATASGRGASGRRFIDLATVYLMAGARRETSCVAHWNILNPVCQVVRLGPVGAIVACQIYLFGVPQLVHVKCPESEQIRRILARYHDTLYVTACYQSLRHRDIGACQGAGQITRSFCARGSVDEQLSPRPFPRPEQAGIASFWDFGCRGREQEPWPGRDERPSPSCMTVDLLSSVR